MFPFPLWRRLAVLLAATGLAAAMPAGQRINHEGRILGPLPPAVTTPLLFYTPEADAIIGALQILPVDNAWNERVNARPLLANSAAMIAQISADLPQTRQGLRAFYEMNYVLVPENQPRLPMTFLLYPDQSDLEGGTFPVGLYPIPPNLPIESWPLETGTLTLEDWQQDLADAGGDRHSIILAPGSGTLWETWQAKRVGTAWQASNGAKFPLNSNALRPANWTSGDAAGLSMFCGLVRYDECARGMVEHALRLVVKRSRQSYLYPATHQAGSTTLTNVPAMGQRLRLRSSFAIPASWSIYEKAVARALQKYGALVADNGNFFSISVAPDPRFPSNAFSHLSSLVVSDFEVVQSTGPTEGPRSPGAPMASVGPDQIIRHGQTATLPGVVSGGAGTVVQWKLVSGPGTATIANAAAAGTTAQFSAPGRYVLMLSADDGVHAVAYDALTIDVAPVVALQTSGPSAALQFSSASGQLYRVDRCDDLTSGTWTLLAGNVPGTGGLVTVTDSATGGIGRRFYRVVVLP